MSPAVILCSGGLDSTTLAFHLRERDIELVPVFFDYGQHCVEHEWRILQEVLPKAGVCTPERVTIADVFRHSRSRLIVECNPWNDRIVDSELYVPYRTLLFFSLAAAYAQSVELTDVYSGFINSNHAKELDCSAAFLNQLDNLAENVGPVRFHMPFRNWTKTQVVAEAVRLEVAIGQTFSCQLFSDIPCGACPNCVERLNALEAHTRAP